MKLYFNDHFGNNIQGRDQQILRTSAKQEYNFHNDIGIVQSNIQHFKSLLAQVEAGIHISLANISGLQSNELKLHLVNTYKKKIKENQYNLINLLISEN
jgi:hypothetical protein